MEIKDYLKVLGKRAWLLVMIPAVAGVVAGLIAVGQPQAYRTTATLQLPRRDNASPAEVAQLVADFRAAADNPTVQNEVSDDTGVSVRRIRRVRITQVGDSSQLTLTFQDKEQNSTEAKAVVLGVAGGALDYLQAPRENAGQRAVDDANEKVARAGGDQSDAADELNALYAQIQTSTPREELNRLRNLSNTYDTEIIKARASLDTVAIDVYTQAKQNVDARINELGLVLPQITQLEEKQSVAAAALLIAQEDLESASDALADIDTPLDITFSAEGTAVVRKTRVVKTAAAAVVAGFPIAIGVVLLLDALQKRRQAKVRSTTARAERDLGDELELDAGPAPDRLPADAAAGALATGALAVGRGGEHDTYDDEFDDDEYDDDVTVRAEDDQTELDDDLDVDDEVDEPVSVAVAVHELDDDLDVDDEVHEPASVAPAVDELDDELDVLDEIDDDDEVAGLGALDDLDELEDDEADELDARRDVDVVLDEDVLDEDLDDDDLDDDDLDTLDTGEVGDIDDLAIGALETPTTVEGAYDAELDDELPGAGASADRNGHVRAWARVPASDGDLDDEGTRADH